ncbi:MAG: TRAP transporter substrate-binding protein [Proteobacteria bacterium]|nr:TRAP transporter substrate-binding protein [Pseudomonadota bacterium]MDA1057944.1 TRAP transporter substrate-binding protein [Pseudomonadota bacterium]
MTDFMISRRTAIKGAAGVVAAGTIAGVPSIVHAAKFKYGTAAAPSSISARAATDLFKAVAERTNGDVDFEVFAGNLGVGEKELIEGASIGTVDGSGTAYTGTREFDIFYSPYFFRDSEHAFNVANGFLREKTTKVLLDRYSVHFLGVGRAGPWNLYLRDKVEGFDDLKGKKIRASPIEGQVKGLEHLGAEPTVIAFNELYGALQQGIVDGAATLAALAIPQKFYEVTKYIARNDFGLGLDKFFISSRVWDQLSKKNQDIVQGTFDELEPELYAKRVDAELGPSYAKWEELNGAGTVLTLDSTAAQKKMAPLNKQLADEVFGAGTWAKIEAA